MATLPRFKKGDRVIYIPAHAEGDIHHKDVEHGVVRKYEHIYQNGGSYFVLYDNLDMKMETGDEPYTAKLTPAEFLWTECQIPWWESH